ncbi:cytochrome c oxidase, cbb3-type, CcoQ subunit [Helicobacter valdiviensis]|uniref:Cytochrome c oxidase, cbb3-type, CcoQ subunit n=1 Tax=Helicobacter valdiviensis TaxID=1458358 RepID=A0A2W6PQF9_9HELI|nr:cytochrome c oxidase, cbb3-type, CcoQ subunit [Helicobacter valdiviensis]PZT48963.1 cytochrome c oxidase, cbb3-type, CcoQ subunit [Helicobacter valdiviensis]
MEYETIRVLQGYIYWFLTIVLVVFLYGYIYHLYKNQRSGKVDYEKYSRLALDDDLGDTLIEARNKKEKKES